MPWTLDPSNTAAGGITWVGPGPVPLVSGAQRQQIIASLQSQPQQGPTPQTQPGPSGISSTTTTSLPAWLQPYASQFLQNYAGLAMPGGRPPQMPSGLNLQVAPFTQQQQQALQMMQGVTPAAGALAGGGAQSLFSTLAGQYLNPQSNPYLDATYKAAAQPMVEEYQYATAPSLMASAQRAGQMGGSAYNEQNILNQYGLGRNLSDLAATVYGGNYQNERQRQAAAQTYLPSTLASMYQPAGALLGAGAYQQQQNQSMNDVNFANALRAQEYPFQLLSGFGGALGQAGGGTGSTTSFMNPQSSGGGLPSWVMPSIAGLGVLPGLAGAIGSAFGTGQ